MIKPFNGFDYGGGVAEKESNFKLWDKEGSRVALVDADLLPYRIAFVIPPIKAVHAAALVESGVYKSIIDTPQFESAFDTMCSTLNKWVRAAKCDSAKLYATGSSSNFRLDIAFTDDYKGTRSPDKPPFFTELKTEMLRLLGAELSNGNEADDELSIEAWRRFRILEKHGVVLSSPMHKELCDCVIISIDKDSTITPCWNYNPDTKRLIFVDHIGVLEPKYSNKEVNDYEYIGTGKYWKRGEKEGQEKTKRICVGKKPSTSITGLKGSGLKFFYAQIIMGDTADNYSGLPNKGCTLAFNLLDKCTTEKEMYLSVLGLYKEVYGNGTHIAHNFRGGTARLTAYDRMLEQGRLAWMSTYHGEIWREDKSPIKWGNDKEIWHG